jgi:coenzyme F420 hydrogenase subunit beta
MNRVKNLSDVVDWRLCLGCGACAYICPEAKVDLLDFIDEGIRPVARDHDCHACRDCLDVCPGVESDYQTADAIAQDGLTNASSGFDSTHRKQWGPIVAMWEGHAADPLIRHAGSSGGAITAIAAYCIEHAGMHGVLEVAAHPDDPVRNETRLARDRGALLEATGSRYAPASVCNGLGLIEQAPSPCAVVGKPSEIAALRNAMKLRPALADKVGVSISFFCAETPSTGGSRALVERMGADPDDLSSLRYRGLGWPGHFAPTPRGSSEPVGEMTYADSWHFLQAFRPWSTRLWPDGSGELADISCGDPWYEAPDGENPGSSLVVARTARGREIIEGAVAAGYLVLTPAEAWKLTRSQDGLLKRKAFIRGRRVASRMLGAPVTRFVGLDLAHAWKTLPINERLRTVAGTLRRMLLRGFQARTKLDASRAIPVHPPRTTH